MDDLAVVVMLLEDAGERRRLRFKNPGPLQGQFEQEIDAFLARVRSASDPTERERLRAEMEKLARRWHFEDLLERARHARSSGADTRSFLGGTRDGDTLRSPRPPESLLGVPVALPRVESAPPAAARGPFESLSVAVAPLVAYPEVRAPDVVRVATTFDVSVRTRARAPFEGATPVAFPRERPGPVRVTARLSLPPGAGLVPTGSDHAALEVPEGGDSAAVAFELRAERAGTWDVSVALEDDHGVTITRLSRKVAVVEETPAVAPPIDAASSGMTVSFAALPTSGLVLKFAGLGQDDANHAVYRVTLQGVIERRPVPPRSEALVVKAGGAEQLARLCRELLGLPSYRSPDDREAHLRGLGRALAAEFLPASVRGELKSADYADGTPLHVESDDAWVPWELLWLGDGAKGAFLGERFAVTRGLLKQSLRPEGRRGPVTCIDALSGTKLTTARERAALAALAGEEPAVLGAFSEVRRAMEEGAPAGVVHVACHGVSSATSPLGSALKLAGGDLVPAHVPAMESPAASGLLVGACVILNACQSGAPSAGSVTADETWPQAIMAGGAAACVATSWNVDNDVAGAFAEEVYALLGRRVTLAEAARRARLTVRRDGEADRLAWAVYALPSFRLAKRGAG